MTQEQHHVRTHTHNSHSLDDTNQSVALSRSRLCGLQVFKKLKKALESADSSSISVSAASRSSSSDASGTDEASLQARAKFLTNAVALCEHLTNNRWVP